MIIPERIPQKIPHIPILIILITQIFKFFFFNNTIKACSKNLSSCTCSKSLLGYSQPQKEMLEKLGETLKKSIPIAYKGKGVGILITKKFGKILVFFFFFWSFCL